MVNNLINAIKKVNSINYISNLYKLAQKDLKNTLDSYKRENSIEIQDDIEEFILFVNGKMFYDWIVFKPICDIPFFKEGFGDVGLFYSLKNGTQYDALTTMKSNNDIIKKTDFLLAEATPGDFIVISFSKEDYGKIYFIAHDVSENEEARYLVANSLNDFIKYMYKKKD